MDRAKNIAKLALSIIFAWSMALIIGAAGVFAANVVYTPGDLVQIDPPDLALALIAILQYGIGAFCLGTLEKKENPFTLAIVFVLPTFLLLQNTPFTFPAMTIPLLSIFASFVGSTCAVAAGQRAGFNRGKAALDIAWYHWLWLFPTTLFQAVCVPLAALFALFSDFHVKDSIEHGQLIFEVSAVILIPISLWIAYNGYRLLSKSSKLTVMDVVGLVCSWLFLAAPQTFLLLFQIGKSSQY